MIQNESTTWERMKSGSGSVTKFKNICRNNILDNSSTEVGGAYVELKYCKILALSGKW